MKNGKEMAFKACVAAAALLGSLEASATLILDKTDFGGTTSSLNNDFLFPGSPLPTLELGRLQATQAGTVDFFYIGNEAGYTNTLHVGSYSDSTAGRADNVWSVPGAFAGSVGVSASEYVDFGFCTDGGASVPGAGFCAHNDILSSLIAQFNAGPEPGYRSIAFHALSYSGGSYYLSNSLSSDYWLVLWDDSGAANDDNHDDYVALARFTPRAVPEPGALTLLGAGLLALGYSRRRRAQLEG